MSAKAAQVLILRRERESGFYCYRDKTDQDEVRRSTSFWDELAQKWPKERFHSFFTVEQNA